MKNVRVIIVIFSIFIAFHAISDSQTQIDFERKFKSLIASEIKKAPPFNKPQAEQEALREMKLEKLPEKVPPPNTTKFYSFISKRINALIGKKFTKKMRSEIILKAMKKFNYNEDADAATKRAMEKKQKAYIRKHFDIPKNKYIKKLRKKLRRKYKKKAAIYKQFAGLVKHKENIYPRLVRTKAISNSLKLFLSDCSKIVDKETNVKHKINLIENIISAIKKVMKSQKLSFNINTEKILDTCKEYEDIKLKLIVLRETSGISGSKQKSGKGIKNIITVKQLARTINTMYRAKFLPETKRQWDLIYDNIMRSQYVIARRMLAEFQFSQPITGKIKKEITELIYKINGVDKIHNRRKIYEVMSMEKLIKYIDDFLILGQQAVVENFFRFAKTYIDERNFVIAKSMIKKAYKNADGDCKVALDILYDKCSIKMKEQRKKDRSIIPK